MNWRRPITSSPVHLFTPSAFLCVPCGGESGRIGRTEDVHETFLFVPIPRLTPQPAPSGPGPGPCSIPGPSALAISARPVGPTPRALECGGLPPLSVRDGRESKRRQGAALQSHAQRPGAKHFVFAERFEGGGGDSRAHSLVPHFAKIAGAQFSEMCDEAPDDIPALQAVLRHVLCLRVPPTCQCAASASRRTCSTSWGVSGSSWDSRTVTTATVSPTALKTSRL